MKSRTLVAITYDDCNDSVLTEAEPLLTAAGFPATLYVSPIYLDAANKLTQANLATLYALGWDMGIQQYNDIDDAFTCRTSSGLTRSSTTATFDTGSVEHGLETGDSVLIDGCADPRWNGTFGPITVTGDTTFTFTCAGTEVSPAVGYAECMLAGRFARVTEAAAKESVQSVQEYLAKLGLRRGNDHLAPAGGQFNETVLEWMDEIGIASVRSTTTQSGLALMPRCFDARSLKPYSGKLQGLPGVTLDQETASNALSYVDTAIEYGASMIFYGHKIADGAGTGTTLTQDTAELSSLITGLLTRQRNGLLEVVTITELYKRASRAIRPFVAR